MSVAMQHTRHITRLERIKTTSMEPMTDGSYREHTHDSWAWRCDDCGLVWDRKNLAEHCGERKHVPQFEQTYYGRGYVLNGVFQGQIYRYTRRSLRREKASS